MKIEYMREFVALAENLNFSKTADKLFITQPALSRHLAYIEETVGVKLLIRNTHTAELTTAGNKLVQDFRFLLQTYDESIYQTSLLSSGYTGECRIGILYYGVEEYMDPIIHQFRESYPDIKLPFLSCQPPYIMESILKDEIDIGQYIYWKRPTASDNSTRKFDFEYIGSEERGNHIEKKVRFHTLGLENFILVVSNNHILANRDRVSISELMDSMFIFFENNKFNDYARQLLNIAGLKYKQYFVAGQVDVLGMVIEETGGVALQPRCIKHMQRTKLKYIDIIDDAFCSYMCLAYKVDNNNPAIPLFINTANKIFPPI